jgi:mgtE-like transporter
MEIKRIMLVLSTFVSIADAITKDKKRWLLKDIKEPFVSLFLCTMGDLITGIIIGVFTSSLEMLPALIVLIPAAIGMRGNIFATLGSRLGTYLHTGQITPDFETSKILNQNISSSLALTLITSIYLGIISALVAKAIGLEVGIIDLLLISLIAGILSAIIMFLFTITVAFFSYRHGWDPDNMTAPLITLFGDMTTLPLLFISLNLIIKIDIQIKTILLILFLIAFLFVMVYSLSKKAKPYYNKILKESTPVLLLCGFLGILSGTVLGGKIEGLIAIPGILIMIPPFLEDGGAMGGILAARLSSAIHLGVIEYDKKIPKKVIEMFLTMHLLGIVIFSLIGCFAYLIALAINIATLPLHMLVIVSVVAGEMLITMVNLITYYISTISFKKGIDPDNVTIPIITSVMDIVGVACLILILMVIGAV